LEKTTIKLNRSLKFEKSIETLDDIINYQRSPFIKTGLGYDKSQMTTKEDSKATEPLKKVNEGKYKSYVDVLKISINDEDNKKKENDVSQKPDLPHKDNKDEFRRSFPPRWSRTTRFEKHTTCIGSQLLSKMGYTEEDLERMDRVLLFLLPLR
jgi:hypothetical protein